MRVIGLDPSLTSTGVAGQGWTDVIEPGKLTGHSRLKFIRDQVAGYTSDAEGTFVVIEGPSYGSAGAGQHERAGLWWLLTQDLWRRGVAYAVVPPSNRMKYATGRPQANKDKVLLAVARWYTWFDGGNDEADAAVLAAMGYDYLGVPVVVVPKVNRSALNGCQWPDSILPNEAPQVAS